MKIGLLSMQRVINYGSVLQAYSLKKIVEDLTDEKVYFLDLDYENAIDVNMPIQDSDDYSSKPYIKGTKFGYFTRKCINKLIYRKLKKKILEFQDSELGLSEDHNHDIFDMIIEGSDEVFGAKKRLSLQMYGEIPNARHQMTYAVACGSTQFEGLPIEQLPRIKAAMKKYSMISVRDQHTYDYVSKIYSGNIERHMDPVLMGPLRNIKHQAVPIKNYMIIYAYGDRIRKEKEICEIQKFAKEHKLVTVSVGAPQYWTDRFIAVSPFEMLDYFYHAKYVVTDTFHGAIFSIINSCKFAVILRESNQFKLGGLLKQLDLDTRIVDKPERLGEILEKSINYSAVYEILEREKVRTTEYLKKGIRHSIE